MSRAQQIRQWLAENPGWHFPADVAEVVPATTQRVAACLSEMASHRQIERAGRRGMFKYRSKQEATQ